MGDSGWEFGGGFWLGVRTDARELFAPTLDLFGPTPYLVPFIGLPLPTVESPAVQHSRKYLPDGHQLKLTGSAFLVADLSPSGFADCDTDLVTTPRI